MSISYHDDVHFLFLTCHTSRLLFLLSFCQCHLNPTVAKTKSYLIVHVVCSAKARIQTSFIIVPVQYRPSRHRASNSRYTSYTILPPCNTSYNSKPGITKSFQYMDWNSTAPFKHEKASAIKIWVEIRIIPDKIR